MPKPKAPRPKLPRQPHSRLEDMAGRVVHHLVVVERSMPNDEKGNALWRLQCQQCQQQRTMPGIAIRVLERRRKRFCLPGCGRVEGARKP